MFLIMDIISEAIQLQLPAWWEKKKVYAVDINPVAIQQVRSIALKKQLTNIETICSDCTTGLPDKSIDLILLYDTFHEISEPDKLLRELHRVLKSDGIFIF